MVDRHPGFSRATVSQVDAPQDWDRLPGEPEKAWAAFCQYREMRPRSTLKLAQALGRRNVRRLQQWAHKWRWVERANAYEAHLDKMWRATKAGELELVTKNTKQILTSVRQLVSDEISVRIEKAEREKELKEAQPEYEREPAVPNMAALARLLKDSIILTRLVMGESTENVVETASFDPSKLSTEELRELQRLQQKAKSK